MSNKCCCGLLNTDNYDNWPDSLSVDGVPWTHSFDGSPCHETDWEDLVSQESLLKVVYAAAVVSDSIEENCRLPLSARDHRPVGSESLRTALDDIACRLLGRLHDGIRT